MPNAYINIPSLYGGVSRQPAGVRHPNQCENAENVYFSVVDGASKRPNTSLIKLITGLTSGQAYRMHVIERDATEQYLVFYGASTLRVFTIDGTEATVNWSTGTATIYNSATGPNDLALCTAVDYTLIANRTIPLGTIAESGYTVAAVYTTWEAMLTAAPGDGYYQTSTASNGRVEGYWHHVGAAYTRMAAPGQVDAYPDPNKMPLSMVRTSLTPLVFRVDKTSWSPRWTGDPDVNPIPDLWKLGRAIRDITFHRNRLVLAGDEQIVMSQAGDFFNFFIEDYDNLGDSDPIQMTLNSDSVTLVDFVVPFQKTLIIFTRAGRQFELNTPDTFTPTNASITPSTSYPSNSAARPRPLGSQIYFASGRADAGQVYEYLYDFTQATNIASDISAHVEGYLPPDIQTIAASSNHNTLLVLPTNSTGIYAHRLYWQGQDKVQSAWSTYSFAGRVVDVAIIRDTAYLLLDLGGNTHALVGMPLRHTEAPSGMPYQPLLDNLQTLTGVYNAVTNTTTWTSAHAALGADTVVLGAAFGTRAGDHIATTTAGAALTAAGRFDAGPCYMGRSYTMSLELSRPYAKDASGQSIFDGKLLLRQLLVLYSNTGAFQVDVAEGQKPTRTKPLKTRSVGGSLVGELPIIAEGKFTAHIQGDSIRSSVTIRNTTALPCSLTAVEWVGDFVRRK